MIINIMVFSILLMSFCVIIYKNTLYKFVLVFIYTCIFLPAGSFYGVPVKYALFGAVLLLTFVDIILEHIKNNNQKNIVKKGNIYISKGIYIVFFSATTFVLIGVITGLIYNNSIDKIFNDFSGFILLFLLIPILKLIQQQKIEIKKFINHFLIASSIFGIFALILFGLVSIIKIDFYVINKYLLDLNLGVIAPVEGKSFLRYFFRSNFYNMLAFCICAISLFSERKKKDFIFTTIMLLINGGALYISHTRGLWIGAFIAIFAYVFIDRIKRKAMVSVVGVLLGFVGVFGLVALSLNISDRFNLISRFFGDWGTSVKIEQITNCLKLWSNKPFFGNGFGFAFENVDVRGGIVYNIELTFFEYLAKTGIVGMLILSILFLFPLIVLFWRIVKGKNYAINTDIESKLFYAYIAMFAAGATNPYMLSSLGMLYLVYIYAAQQFSFEKRRLGNGTR